MISFSLTEEQEALRDLARQFAREEFMPRAAEHDREGKFPIESVRKAHALGLMNCVVPEEYGGPGLGCIEDCIIQEELAYGCIGMTLPIAVNNLAVTPVKVAGTHEQKMEFLAPLAKEFKLASYCLTEPSAGSDAAGIQTLAKRVGDCYELTGTKRFITGAGYADWFVVFAYTDKEKRHKGISAFICPRSLPGVSLGKKEDMMGQRASDTREVMFDQVPVPAKWRLGAEGEGFKIAMQTFDRTRPPVSGAAVGLAKRAMDEAVRYAKERKTFGVPIAEHQMIQSMLAEMARDVEAARLLTWHAAWIVDQGRRNTKETAIAKLFSADMAMRVTTDAVQVFGGYGYSKEYPVEKLMRDAKVIQIYEGTSQVQRLIIAKQLLS